MKAFPPKAAGGGSSVPIDENVKTVESEKLQGLPQQAKTVMNRSIIASVFILLAAGMAGSYAGSLEEDFKNPPNAVGPYVWWHWMGSNISKVGITKDLEVEARVREFHEVFDIQPDCPAEDLAEAACTAIALDRLVANHRLGSAVKHGPVTLLSVIERGRKFVLLCVQAESVSGPILEIGNTNSRYRYEPHIREISVVHGTKPEWTGGQLPK